MRVWLSDGRGARSQMQVAMDAGITQSYYSMIESGLRTPSVPLAKRLGSMLAVDWRRFYEEDALDDRENNAV